MPIVGSLYRIYQIKLFGLYGAAPTLNTFDYRVGIVAQPTALRVAEEFRDQILPEIIPTQVATQTYTSIECIDAMDDANFATLSVSTAGTRAGTQMAAFIVWSMRLLRSSRDMRSGWKRFSGLTEEDVSGGAFTAAYLALLNTQAPLIADNILVDLADLLPIVLRDRPTPNDPLIDPDDPTTWRYTLVESVSVPNRVTSQNSRKTF